MLLLFHSELFRYRLGRAFSWRINSRHLLWVGEVQDIFDSRLAFAAGQSYDFTYLTNFLFMMQRW